MNYLPRNADLIFTHSPSWFGKAIRWAGRSKGEKPTYANHVAGIVEDFVVEALWTATETPFLTWLEKCSVPFQIWRMPDLSYIQGIRIANKAESYVGRQYGWWKLGAHLGDCLLSKIFGGNPYFFRRMLYLDDYPICSWLWAYAYASEGIMLGGDPKGLDPDTIHDFVSNSSDWIMVAEITE